MNFAPYQDDAPESGRTSLEHPTRTSYQPPPSKSTRTPIPAPPPTSSSYADDDLADEDFLPDPSDFEASTAPPAAPRTLGGFGNRRGADVDDGERRADLYATSLPMRLDVEAMMAYVALPPAGPALLLVLEHRSDYVRFHAWQSALLFTFLFLIHLIFSFSKFISYTLLFVDIILIGYLASHAYRDADSLVRTEIPYFGRLASNFVDEE